MKSSIIMPYHNSRILFLAILLMASSSLTAQKPLSSPYSRYGIGDLFHVTNLQTMSLGGAGIALRSPTYINFTNPASYTAFDTLSFVFEGSVVSNFQTLKTQNLSQSANFTTLKSLLFGFPVAKWWKVSAGLLPFSEVGYKVGDNEVVTGVGSIKRNFEGSGGFNQIYMGNGFKISDNFSAGLNVSYLFGSIDRVRALTFPDSIYIRYFRVTDNISVTDFLLTYGLQYYSKVGKDMFLTAGATFSNTTNIRASKSSLSEVYNEGSTGVVYIKDTVENQPGVRGKIRFPAAYGFGFALEKGQRWLITADVHMQDWSKFSMFGENDSLKSSLEGAAGFEFIPNNNSLSSYLEKVNYRVGVRYAKSYLQLRTHQLEEMSFTFGFGLPLPRTRSKVNLGMEIGRRGTTADNLIKENFFMITLGVSVFENWFYRKRFE